jgi:cytochrome c-type biogenesis protein CcmH/NrfG
VVYEAKREFGNATEAFARTLALDPAHAEAPLRLAAAELSQGHNARALELLKDILKRDPQNAGAKALINEMIKLGILGTK